jgi:translation initiation factor 1A
MPNKKGGKAYKKGKGSAENEVHEFIDIMPGQYMARAIRILGDRNVLCYCDDNVIRISHICRKMKGRVWVEVGDLVLMSLRDFSTENPKTIKRGDILAKYPPEQVRFLKKEGIVNQRLFMKMEDGNGITIEAVGEDKTGDTKILHVEDDFGFEFENASESESNSDTEAEEKTTIVKEKTIVAKKDKLQHRGEREIRDTAQIQAVERAVENTEKDIDLDDL